MSKTLFILSLILIVNIYSKKVRPSSHSGSWYPNDIDELKNKIKNYLEEGSKEANTKKIPKNKSIKAVISPHAGYRFCGPTAGAVYSQINPENYEKVVIIGPSHYESFKGVLLSSYEYFDSPFGEIKVDKSLNDKLLKNKHFNTANQRVDIQEHSIEMEIPFLKYIFDQKNRKFEIIPMIVGYTNLNDNFEIANALKHFYQDEKVLFVISSDFCHWGNNYGYLFYDNSKGEIWESIKFYDLMAIKIMNKFNPKEFEEYFDKYGNTICGRKPISILLSLIDTFEKETKDNDEFICLKYSQSEKVVNKSQNSVSYAGTVFYVKEKSTNSQRNSDL